MFLKVLRYMLYFIMYISFIILVLWLIYHIENVAYLITGGYPGMGEYYVSFSKEEENIKPSVYYKQLIHNEEIDLSNLVLYVNETDEYLIGERENIIEEKEKIYDDAEIRIILLRNGLAELVDRNIALEAEVEAQENAVRNKNGVWEVNYSSKITLHDIVNKIFGFLDSYLGKILVWIFVLMATSGILSFIVRKILTYRRIDTIFMGGISSGKTTIVRRLENPNIRKGQLLAEATSTKSRKVSKGNRIPSGNKDIHVRQYDNPGNELGKMVDELKKFSFSKSEKRVVIYVISFTKDNKRSDINYRYSNREIIRASALVQILKTSRGITRANKIIVFFNKCDLIYNTEEDFWRDKTHEEIKNIYKDVDEMNGLYKYSDCILYGSATEGWGMSELVNHIKELC